MRAIFLMSGDPAACYMCDRRVTGARVWMRALQPAIIAAACPEHATELVLAA